LVLALACCAPACGSDKGGPGGSGGAENGGQSSGGNAAAGTGAAGGTSNATGGASPGGSTANGGNSGGQTSSGGQQSGGATGNPNDGTIGSGSVACTPVAGGMCSAGTACCSTVNSTKASCVASFAACSCYADGSCPILGCDGPEDCPGKQCCAAIDDSQSLLKTACRSACAAAEIVVCHAPSDCKGSNPACNSYGGYVDVCF
jgi:hypothetical protein